MYYKIDNIDEKHIRENKKWNCETTTIDNLFGQ